MNYDIVDNEYLYEDADFEARSSQPGKFIFWVAFVPSCIASLFLLQAGYLWQALVPITVVLAIATFIAPQVMFYFYFGMQALDPIFLTAERAVFTPVKALALFMILMYAVSLGKVRQRILVSKSVILVMLVFGFWGILISPLSIGRFGYIVALKNSAQVVVQVILVAGAIHFLDSRKRVFSAFLWCFLGGVLMGVRMLITGGISPQYLRATLGEYANPQTACYALSVSLIGLCGLWSLKKPRKVLVFYLSGAVVLLMAMLMTGSRASLVAVFVALSIGIILAKRIKITKRILISILIVIILVAGVLYILTLGILQEQSQERLESLIVRDRAVTSASAPGERLTIFKRVLSLYFDRGSVFGWGFGNSATAMELYRGERRDIHNSILSPLCDSGPLGFILFISGLILLYSKVRSITNPRMNAAAVMIYIFLILSALAHTAHFTKWFWIPVTMCLLLAEQSKREEYSDYDVIQEWEPELPLRM
jgi:O-antigen ligase